MTGPLRPPVAALAAAPAGRWALVIALGALVIGLPLLGWGFQALWWLVQDRTGQLPRPTLGRSLVVGVDNRVSTSKATALAWTYSVAAAVLSFIIARWLGHPRAFTALDRQGVSAQYASLVGGPLGAAIFAKGIVTAQVNGGSTAKPPATRPTVAQLVQNDTGGADLGDVQYLLFNVVALIFFYGALLHAPQAAMPKIPDVLLGLTGLSAVTFVGKKTLPSPGAIAGVRPTSGRVGDAVTIATAGLIQAPDDLAGVTVRFGSVAVSDGSLTARRTTSLGVLIDTRVPSGAAGEVEVSISVLGGSRASSPGFKVAPTIVAGDLLIARHGDPIAVRTTGVAGLGPELHDLTATIGGERADARISDGGDLLITVPIRAPLGANELVLDTSGGRATASVTVVEMSSNATRGGGEALVISK